MCVCVCVCVCFQNTVLSRYAFSSSFFLCVCVFFKHSFQSISIQLWLLPRPPNRLYPYLEHGVLLWLSGAFASLPYHHGVQLSQRRLPTDQLLFQSQCSLQYCPHRHCAWSAHTCILCQDHPGQSGDNCQLPRHHLDRSDHNKDHNIHHYDNTNINDHYHNL